MCTTSALIFCFSNIAPDEIAGKRVLEVGSANVNGSVRQVLKGWKPSEYIGVDVVGGDGVDRIVDVTKLLDVFPHDSFDVVISTEMLEHVRDWRAAIHNIKTVAAPGALIIITTRSWGFPFHAYPHDFWRYELSDMATIFGDLQIEKLESDPTDPGVFLRARKPLNIKECEISNHLLYNVMTGIRAQRIDEADIKATHYRWLVLRMWATKAVRRVWHKLAPPI